MNLFVEVVLPVLVVFAAGFGLQKWMKLNIRSVSTVAIYVFVPCLVFRTIYEKDLDFLYLEILIFSLVLMLVLIAITKITVKIKGYSQSTESGLILSSVFMNSGNYGAPVVLFAFGEAGFAYGIMFFALQSIFMNFFGVYYAARGTAGMKAALRTVLAMPATYAFLIALLVKAVHVHVPERVFSMIDLLASAAIPVVMVGLGMQLAEISVHRFQWGKMTYGVAARLLLSPLIAWAIVQLMPMDPLLGKVLIVLSAMPSAGTATMYAVQFNSEPQLVSSVTLFTTIGSILTVTAVLILLV